MRVLPITYVQRPNKSGRISGKKSCQNSVKFWKITKSLAQFACNLATSPEVGTVETNSIDASGSRSRDSGAESSSSAASLSVGTSASDTDRFKSETSRLNDSIVEP